MTQPAPHRTLAVDWSGARTGARRTIWLAEVVEGELVRLENGRSRDELIRHLVEEAEADPHLVVGLDFAFSFPAWFLAERGLSTAREAWALTAERGEVWLGECEPPFWGAPGKRKPAGAPARHFRRTELEAAAVPGAQPKSVFQILGAGAVGTGSLRGMPHLLTLAEAGFSIWPFDPPGWPRVVEIFPRLLTGEVVKSRAGARAEYLEGSLPEIPDALRATAASSEDALDTAVSAVVMARHGAEIAALEPATDPVIRTEGRIWWPGGPHRRDREDAEPAAALAEADEAGGYTAGVPAGTRGGPEGAPAARGGTPDAPGDSADPARCPFCRVARRPSVATSEHGVAIRDTYPVAEGHTLVVPRVHAASVFDLPAETLADLWRLVAEVRARLAEETGAPAFTIGVNDGEAAGQTIPHAHIHVIPRHPGDVEDPRGGIRWVRPDRAPYWSWIAVDGR